MKFPVHLTYDLEYEGFVVDVPTLPGCMSQGKTVNEAMRNIKDAIVDYLAVLKKHHKTQIPIPMSQTRYIELKNGTAL